MADDLIRWHLDQLGFGTDAMTRRREEGERAQMARWGKCGLDLLSIDEDQEETRHRGEWTEAEVDDVMALIEAL
jgi:hypothetical protein